MASKPSRALLWALTCLLAAFAGLLTLSHLRMDHNTMGQLLPISGAATRVGEAMPAAQPLGAININTADVDELCELSGVGLELAKNIILEREQHGRFHYPADLLNVNGIGEKTLQKLLPQICFE